MSTPWNNGAPSVEQSDAAVPTDTVQNEGIGDVSPAAASPAAVPPAPTAFAPLPSAKPPALVTAGEYLAQRAERLTDYHIQLADRFKEWMRIENKPSTADEYTRQLKMLLAWVEEVGGDLRTLPPEAVETYFAYRGFRPGNAVRNMTNCAVRAFMRWALIAGLSVPPLDIPASVRPKGRKKMTTGAGPIVSGESMIPGAPPPANGALPPAPTTIGAPPAVPAPPSTTAAPDPAVGGAPPFGLPPATLPPAVLSQAPQTFAPPSIPAPGVRTRNLSPPRIADKRQSQIRDPLGALLPEGGCLQVRRVSDGSDGQPIGRRVPLGEYREEDLRGYQRIEEWIREVLHPGLEPLRAATVTYIVEQYDGYGRFLPPARQIPIQNTGPSTSVFGASAPGTPLDRIITGFVARLETAQKQMEADYTRWQKAMEDAKKGGNNDTVMLSWLLTQRPPAIDLKATMSEFIGHVEKAVAAKETTVVGPAVPSPEHNVHRDLIDLVKTQLDKAETKATAPKPADPVDMAIRMAEAFKPPPAITDPRVTMLEQTVQEMRTTNERLLQQLTTAKPITFEDKLKELSLIDQFLERRGGGANPLEAFGMIAEKLPETIAALAGLRNPVALPPAANQPVKPAAGATLPAAAQQPPPVPAAIVEALRAITQSATDADVLNRTQSLIVTLAQSTAPWNGVVDQLIVELKDIQTVEELQSTVTKLFRALGGRDLLVGSPGIAAALAESLGRHFDTVICQNLGIAPRKLIGASVMKAAEEAPKAEVPKPKAAAGPATAGPAGTAPVAKAEDEPGADEAAAEPEGSEEEPDGRAAEG